MLIPNKLQKGDTIGLIAPSKPFNRDKRFELDNFIEYMESIGFLIRISENFFKTDKYGLSAGTPKERAKDLNEMFSDKAIKGIWCYQGGSSSVQILNLIDYKNIKKNPKLFIGKSDIDVLLLAINKMTNLVTFHGCDAKIGSDKELDFLYTKEWLKKRLTNGAKEIDPSRERICIRKGNANGKLVGCNISSILKLNGTRYSPKFKNSILFIETYKYDLRKLVENLTIFENIGVFNKIKGLVIGHNKGFEGNGFNFNEIVKDITKEYNFPILHIFEFGHHQSHAFLPIGVKIELDATNKKIKILDEFVK